MYVSYIKRVLIIISAYPSILDVFTGIIRIKLALKIPPTYSLNLVVLLFDNLLPFLPFLSTSAGKKECTTISSE